MGAIPTHVGAHDQIGIEDFLYHLRTSSIPSPVVVRRGATLPRPRPSLAFEQQLAQLWTCTLEQILTPPIKESSGLKEHK